MNDTFTLVSTMKTIKEIKTLIADNKIEQASNLLLAEVGDDAALENQVILLKSQYSDYNQNVHLNLIERSNERTKVVNGLLYVVNELAKKLQESGLKATTESKDTEGVVVKGSCTVLSVLWLNLWGYQNKHLPSVLLSLHPNSPTYNQIADYTAQVFTLDLIYELHHLEILAQNDTEASIKMIIETRSKMPSPAFKNNIWTGIQYLVKDEQGIWKIWSGDTIELKYI